MSIVYLLGKSKIEIICHEVEYIESYKGIKNIVMYIFKKVEIIRWNFSPKLLFHSHQEINKFVRSFNYQKSNIQLIAHNYYFQKKFDGTEEEARQILLINTTYKVFLCIGFIAIHKGFHKAINSFIKTKSPNNRLFIIGHVKNNDLSSGSYIDFLRTLANQDKRVIICNQYLDEKVFDMWIAASNYVILPYSQVWSSGVIERVKLYNKISIVADSGALPEQADQNSIIFKSEGELDIIMRSLSNEL